MARAYLERADLIPPIAEIFRRYGFDGASIGIIATETGAGRSSLYHFFPGGKEEMADAVLAHIHGWFEDNIFKPLDEEPSQQALPEMFVALDDYFQSGQRVCLVGAFALDDVRDRFTQQIESYFARWTSALCACLHRSGYSKSSAETEAVSILAAVQGGIVLARASGNDAAFRVAVMTALDRCSQAGALEG